MKPHKVPPRLVTEIADEWNAIASIRAQQLAGEIDLSYNEVLVPAIVGLLGGDHARATLLDVGCGTGVLTARLASEALRTVGVDPSAKSIDEAARRAESLGVTDRLELLPLSVQDWAPTTRERFDCVVANMTLMDAPDLGSTFDAIARLSKPGTVFVWTITHPWFWPRYWGYEDEPWFEYNREIYVEADFRISNATTRLATTHIHRPLEMYTNELTSRGFRISRIEEPLPSPTVMAKYPEPWRTPRFLAVQCSRDG